MIQVGHVYVMEGEHGTVKVGHSKNPDVRLYALDSSGRRLKLVYQTGPREDAQRVERLAHRLLKHVKVHGETFRISVADAKAAIERATRMVDGHEPMLPKTLPAKNGKTVSFLVPFDLLTQMAEYQQQLDIQVTTASLIKYALRELFKREMGDHEQFCEAKKGVRR